VRFNLLARAYCEFRKESGQQPSQTPEGVEGIRADGKWGNLRDYLIGG